MPDKGAEAKRAGKILHDDVGPLLAGAGLQLQLLRMDHPQTAAQIDEILKTLDQAMEHVRSLSQELSPSPFSQTITESSPDSIKKQRTRKS